MESVLNPSVSKALASGGQPPTEARIGGGVEHPRKVWKATLRDGSAVGWRIAVGTERLQELEGLRLSGFGTNPVNRVGGMRFESEADHAGGVNVDTLVDRVNLFPGIPTGHGFHSLLRFQNIIGQLGYQSLNVSHHRTLFILREVEEKG